MKRRRLFLTSLTAASCLLALCALPAHAAPAEDDYSLGLLNSVPIDQPLPEGARAITPEELGDQRVLDLEASAAVTDIMMVDSDRTINTVTWDDASDVVHFYAHDADDALKAVIQNEMPADQAWDLIPAARPIDQLEATIEKMAADTSALPAGLTFVSGKPEPDGTSITIGVEGMSNSRLRASNLPGEILGVPVTFVEDAQARSAIRTRSGAPVISGAVMRGPRSDGYARCSTGFPVTRYADGQLNMISADHCTDLQGENWLYGNGTHSVGRSTFQAPGGTDLELFVESDSVSTWVLVGAYQDNVSVAPIRGYLAPVGGNRICYSGAFSGIVCNNVLENSDVFSCVALQCYWTRWTHQSVGVPAAGSGDSGGPGFALIVRAEDNSVGAYGMGIISMTPFDSNTTCTGEPGASNRLCSPNVGFAPLGRWATAQSTHNLHYTTN